MLIAVDLLPKHHYQRMLLSGIFRFFSDKPEVRLYLPLSNVMNQARPDRVDGVLRVSMNSTQRALIESLSEPSTPTVFMIQSHSPDLYQVCVDHDALCKMAFDHFRICGLHRFAYLYPKDHYSCQWRAASFSALCQDAGFPVEILRMKGPSLSGDEDEVGKTLRRLPNPLGLLLPSDEHGPSCFEFCKNLKLNVPEDVQILGVDNHVDTCLACMPTLSSVNINAERIGYEAGVKLFALMNGRDVERITRVRPDTVVQRGSTASALNVSPEVARVLDFMLANLEKEIEMADALISEQLSRRSIEKLFLQDMGISPMAYLRSMRLERMEYLLETTDLSILKIGRRCGMPNPVNVNRLFRKFHGCTPQQFRKRRSAN